MVNLAFRSFTTFGYFAAALLITIVAVLFLTSLGDDSSGSQAIDTATPTPTQAGTAPAVTVHPPSDSNVWIDPACAEGAAGHAYSDAGVPILVISVRNTLSAGVLANDKATGDETPDCPSTLG